MKQNNIHHYQKLYGLSALSNEDLLKTIGINIGEIDLVQALVSPDDLRASGVSASSILKIKAIKEVFSRYNLSAINAMRNQIKSSRVVAELFTPLMKNLEHEECWVLFLNRANRIICYEKVSTGGIAATVVDTKIVLKKAINVLASGLILLHNHPSNNCTPGDNDKAVTGQISKAAKLFEINLLDHIIITEDSYYSFADEGML